MSGKDDKRQIGAVIIGSGFGGTITALTLAHHFDIQNKKKTTDEDKKKVVLLERGQWWLSHESPFSPDNTKDGTELKKMNMLEYLVKTKTPFNFWAHPDNIEGLFNFISMSKAANVRGLYDFHSFRNNAVNVVTASGVGGGSLIYSNVTVRPVKSVYDKFPKKPGEGLDDQFNSSEKLTYFEKAEQFIGINKVTTNAGLGNSMLERSQTFQNAAKKLADKGIVINKNDYSLNLAISDIPNNLFDYFTMDRYDKIQNTDLAQFTPELIANLSSELSSKLSPDQITKLQSVDIQNLAPKFLSELVPNIISKYQVPTQSNICQRQARCNLGCVPGARHTMNKKLFAAIQSGLPLDVKPLCQADLIEYHPEDDEHPYHIQYTHYENGKRSRNVIKARVLIVSAGTLGSTELLLRSKKGLKLSEKLGEQFATNADLLAAMKLQTKQIDSTRGPINTSHAMFAPDGKNFAFNIEDTAIPPMFANLFATMFENNDTIHSLVIFAHRVLLFFKKPGFGGRLFKKRTRLFSGKKFSFQFMKELVNWIQTIPVVRELIDQPEPTANDPLRIIREQQEKTRNDLSSLYGFANWLFSNKQRPFDSAAQRLSRFFVFSCMGIDNAPGKLMITDGKFDSDWDPKKNAKIFSDIINGVKQLANEIDPNGGNDKNIIIPTWDEKSPSNSNVIVLHPLGGCSMGHTIDDGVVNCYGNVFKPNNKKSDDTYPGFYVIDGSIIPGAIGVNPSLTISALAFRCMKNMILDEKTNETIDPNVFLKL